ncbi:hypothetical protein FACS1894199_08810 [Bacteroidia bacterium]|nr:hypothetical protein FACS1894199_08810 [Bacteroidia bacterium]
MNYNQVEKKSTTSAWVWAVLSIVYLISPIDLVPDIPVIGWIDDFFVVAVGGLNLIQAECQQANVHLAAIVKTIKWAVLILGVIMVLLIILLGSLIVKLFTE